VGLEGRIAPTDFSWYSFLFGRQRNWAEVNFWKPSAVHSVRAPEFSPFLFKLKAPHNAVCGFGYFARYSRLPDWLAWECFGEANGCEDFPAMRGRIGSIRERIEAQERNASDIGCVIVVNAIFFARDGWIRQPSDWPRQNLREMRYDLEEGEGARVWKE
jgi:putative restriction endonuclease